MFTLSEYQFDTIASESERRFVEQLRQFLESDYPEAAGLDEEEGRSNARKLIDQAQRFGLTSREAVLKYVSMLLDYFVHEPAAYAWAHQILLATDLPENQKLLAIEHRLYGTPLWG